MNQPSTTICATICTHNRPTLLARALDSLQSQNVVPQSILVVDNAPPDDRTRQLVKTRFPLVHYVCEPTPGLNFARNRAVRETAEDVVAFLDDDAVATPSWIAALAAVFNAHERVAVCTGRVLPLCLETEAQRLFEDQGGFDRGEHNIHMPGDRRARMHGLRAPLIAWSIALGVGANMAVRRDALREIGPFDIALDQGALLPGGGDVDLIWRALAGRFEVLYAPEALVHHEHRRTMQEVSAQIVGHRRAEIAFLTKSARNAPARDAIIIRLFLFWRLVKPGLRLLNRLLFGKDPLPAKLILRIWGECWRGLGTYNSAVLAANERAASYASTPGREAA
jgi:GT2 family glycosyltransferase